MAPSREERKKSITAMRKQQILDAALAVFSEKGFDRATNEDIAQIAGIAPGTIYNYFPSKRELLIAVVRTFLVTEPFIDLFEHAGETDYPTFLSSVLRNRVDFMEHSDKTRMILLMTEILRDPELKEIYDLQVVKPLMSKMEKYLENKAAEGEFRPVNPHIITRALGGMVLGMLILALIEGENSPLRKTPRRDLETEIAELVMTGIGYR